MSIRIGPLDVMQLIFEVINKLLDKKLISEKDAKEMIKNSMSMSNLTEEQKEEYINSLFIKKDDK